MNIIQAKSFELAVRTAGDPDSQKMILCLPGRLDTKDYAHMASHIETFAAAGYFAVSFDPPGTWESPGGIDLYTMTSYAKAIDELIVYYGNKQTAVLGHSRGGSMALLSGLRNDMITHIVCVMGKANCASFYDDAIKDCGYLDEYRDFPPGSQSKDVHYRLPKEFFEDSLQYDLTSELSICTKPKLFIAGINDKLVRQESMKETYEGAELPKEFHSLESDHDYRYHNELIAEVEEEALHFFTKYNF